MSGPVVSLSPWEYEAAFRVGIARFTANWGRKDAPHYKRDAMEEDRKAQAAAAICELAVAKYTNQYWHAHVWHHTEHWKYRNCPDVGDNIEVRRVRTLDGVAIRRSDWGKVVWAARTADAEYRQVEILGFAEADSVITTIAEGSSWTRLSIDSLEKPWEQNTPDSLEPAAATGHGKTHL